jgi:hypothetical protein
MGYLDGIDEQPEPFEMDMEDGGGRKSGRRDLKVSEVENGTA